MTSRYIPQGRRSRSCAGASDGANIMKNLTRREAVKTGAAIAAVGATATLGLPAVAEAATQDAELLARVAEFYPALEKHNIASEAWHTRRAEADAIPDCPPHAVPAFDKAGHDRWNAFMKAQGVWKLSDKANAAGRALGKAANRVFAVPARTYPGALEKVKIANLATGDGEGVGNADDDLETYQDFDNPWMKKAIADLERLAGAS